MFYLRSYLLGLAMFFLWPTLLCGQEKLDKNEVDKLFKIAIDLGRNNLDSTFLLADQIYRNSTRMAYLSGANRGRMLAAYYFHNSQKNDTAKYLISKSLDFLYLNNELEGGEDFAKAHYYASMIYLRAKEYLLANKYGLIALEVYKEQNDLKYQCAVLNMLGNISFSMDKLPTALDYYLKSYYIKKENEFDESDYLMEFTNIALIYSRMGQYQKAIRMSKSAEKIAVKISDVYSRINILNNLGTYYDNLKNIDSSLFYYREAKTVAINNNLDIMTYLISCNIANMYLHQSKFEESLSILDTLDTYNFKVNEQLKIMSFTLKAKNNLNLKRTQKALDNAREGFKLSKKKGSINSDLQLKEVLSQIFENTGQYDSALYYFKEFRNSKDSIYSIENQSKMSSFYAEVETIEKDSEIKYLEAERLIAQLENKNLWRTIVLGTASFTLVIFSLTLYYKNNQKRHIIEKERINHELDKSRDQLHDQAIRMIYLNNSLAEIQNNLKVLQKNEGTRSFEVQRILNKIQLSKFLDQEWENFHKYFGSAHKGFYQKVEEKYSDLSITEKRLVGLVKMGLTNSEIAGILNIETKSVNMAKYRLKKKMGLEEEQDLQEFVRTLA